jgi:hypothetical protein
MAFLPFERARISRPFTRELSLTAVLRKLLLRGRPTYVVPWYSLNERLLRDIGKSVVDAEIAKLQAQFGVSETAYWDPNRSDVAPLLPAREVYD